MKYKLIGIRPNHQQMLDMVGTPLLKITDGWIEKCYITNVKINQQKKWEFTLTEEDSFNDDEPLFINIKSVKRYCKSHQIELKAHY